MDALSKHLGHFEEKGTTIYIDNVRRGIIPRMKRRNVLILVTPAYQPRLAGIARYARQHGDKGK